MIDRYFELNDSTHNHHKFWEVVLDGTVGKTKTAQAPLAKPATAQPPSPPPPEAPVLPKPGLLPRSRMRVGRIRRRKDEDES